MDDESFCKIFIKLRDARRSINRDYGRLRRKSALCILKLPTLEERQMRKEGGHPHSRLVDRMSQPVNITKPLGNEKKGLVFTVRRVDCRLKNSKSAMPLPRGNDLRAKTSVLS
jgi:hypothetical protein